jgi:hypothetical protein
MRYIMKIEVLCLIVGSLIAISMISSLSPCAHFTVLAKPIQTFLGKYIETDYMFEPPSSTQYLINLTDGGTIQTYYGTFTNTSLEMTSDHQFFGKYKGISFTGKTQDETIYFDETGRRILSEYTAIGQTDKTSLSSVSRIELGNYVGECPNSKDIIKADIGDKWTYTYETRYYQDGMYNKTTFQKTELTVIDLPVKTVQSGTFSTAHIEYIWWDNDSISSKSVEWRRLTDGRLIAEEYYERINGQWVISLKKELLSETDAQIVNNSPAENSQGLAIYVLLLIGLAGPSLVAALTFLSYKTLKRAISAAQEKERREEAYREEKRKEGEQERRERQQQEQQERERQERERRDREQKQREYARNRSSIPIDSSNPFEVLDVPINASKAQVREAFLILSKEWHPDKFAKHADPKVMQLANENYVRIKEAYEAICRTKGWMIY